MAVRATAKSCIWMPLADIANSRHAYAAEGPAQLDVAGFTQRTLTKPRHPQSR
jgi:hypothetical protein